MNVIDMKAMNTELKQGPPGHPSEDALLPWLGLDSIEGLGPKTVQKLLARDLTPHQLWHATPEHLAAWQVPMPLQLAWQQAQQTAHPDKLLAKVHALNVQMIPLNAPQYPKLLAEIYDPPMVLFVRGNLEALTGKTLAWVGTRKASAYGQQVVQKLIQELRPSGVTIVSGLALGIDAMAHEAALTHRLPTLAVLGCGIDEMYPPENEALSRRILASGGAIVSEYRPGIRASKFTFPRRNRIIAGLSYATIVVECPRKSGAMITAREAREENRTVFAVPGNIFSPNAEGPNALLTQGATPLLNAAQLLEDLNWLPPPALKATQRTEKTSPSETSPILPPSQVTEQMLDAPLRGLLQHISYDPISIDDVQAASGVAPAELAQHLLMLELEGVIQRLPAAQICRC